MAYEPNLTDSTHALYDLVCAEEDIEQEQIDAILNNALEQQVSELYNNREDLAEQLSEAGGAIEDAQDEE